jgi:hypothetical protein
MPSWFFDKHSTGHGVRNGRVGGSATKSAASGIAARAKRQGRESFAHRVNLLAVAALAAAALATLAAALVTLAAALAPLVALVALAIVLCDSSGCPGECHSDSQ